MENNINSCDLPRSLHTIQSIGHMFILDRDTLKIKGFSKKIPGELNFTKEELYKLNNFTEILHKEHRGMIYNYLLYKIERKVTRIIVLTNGNSYYAHIYKSGQFLIIELEMKQDAINLPFDTINVMHDDIKFSDYSKHTLVDIVKRITGFKRVLMYEFTKEWHGFVSCEKSDYTIKYDGVYFYESDIPKYVRGLFCKNQIRYIYNRDEEGVDIDLCEENIQNFIDVGSSEIISTNASHKKYLQSINVVSSFSVAILVNKKLWGLIICHDDEPNYISPFIRQQCRLFIDLFSENIEKSIKFEETSFNEYVYKLYKFISVYNFISKEEVYDIRTFVFKQIEKMSNCSYIIGNLSKKIDIVGNESMFYSIIDSNLDKFPDIFYTNDAEEDLYKILNIHVPYKLCKCLILVKLNEKEWVGFVKTGVSEDVKWAGNHMLRIDDSITYPRDNFDFITKPLIKYDPFKFSTKNIEYIRQLLIFLNNRLEDTDFLTEYFITHNISSRQLLMSNILHEIRNPLNAISGLFQIMSQEHTYNEILITDGTKIINQILELSSNLINADKYKLNDSLKISAINWEKTISQCINVYKYMLSPGVNFRYEISEDIPVLLSDSLKIQQLLSNMVSNSVKYTKKGEIVIRVTLLNNIESIWWVKLSVKDTGIGIPIDKQIRLFKTFEQIESDFIHSSGIGLIICSKIVTLLNGKIEFESEVGTGTTFNVLLPLPIDSENEKVYEKKEKLITNDKKSVLIVDDSDINRRVLEYILKNCEIDSVDSGKKAIEMVSKKNYDIIFMDLQMPEMDGAEATFIIRNQYNFKNKIIAVTGHEFDSNFFLSKGFDDFVLKPVDFKKILSFI